MGLRHRSIRLRVGILIIVPVLCLIALYGFVTSITAGSALTQTHAKSIKDDLATPVTAFQVALDAERHDALLSLAAPTNTQYASKLGQQENVTQVAVGSLRDAMASSAVTGYASADERGAIATLLSQTKHNLPALRQNVANDAISVHDALAQYDAIIGAGYLVINEALAEQTNVPLVTQAQAVITLDEAVQAVSAEADLLTADMTQLKFPEPDRIAFAQLANQRQTLTSSALPLLQAPYRALVDKSVTPSVTGALASAENAVINSPWRKGAPPAQLVAAGPAFANYGKAMSTALAGGATLLQQQADHNSTVVILQLVLAAGLGLAGTVVAIVLSLIIGRGLVRQLRELRESALALANEKLPEVISQLRAGEPVDMAVYAPPPVTSTNEIEQVQHAFSVVQQTAVQSAVDEARLRRGISEVFRNLAGRSQSLLHRQLTLLDGMERRATEPDELEDLFRIDHLTTRMRRHAEGLIILSGEAPARGWRQPVPLVDVLRAAVAEVEDYTRIRVLSRTNAAVAGHAVADVIHLIAELAENATVFSPPNTPVRIQGDIVGRGFAIEIEDRGLGISQARIEEINVNLANPPQFDLSGSDRLGLFIAGQLAQRHDIKITLRPSVYGGTTAIVLIPNGLVVEEDTYQRDPALPAGSAPADVSAADRFSARTAALAHATGRSGGSGSVISLDQDYGRMSLAIGGRQAADAQPPVLAAVVSDEPAARISSEELAELGLPVRVRQASMAPQLRGAKPESAEPAADETPSPNEPAVALRPVAEPTPEEARNTMSALQRGWQLGRAEGEQAVQDSSSIGRDGDSLPSRTEDLLPRHDAGSLPRRGTEPEPESASPLPRRGGALAGRMDDALSGGSGSSARSTAGFGSGARSPGGDSSYPASDSSYRLGDNSFRQADSSYRPSDTTSYRRDDSSYRSGESSERPGDSSYRQADGADGAGDGAERPAASSYSLGGSAFGWSDNPFTGRSGSAPVNRSEDSSAGRTDDALGGGTDSGSFARPDSGSSARPDSGSSARHDSGSFARPDSGSFARPDSGSFGRHDNRQRDTGPFSTAASAAVGWPDSTVPSRLITDRLPADPLAADRLAAERLAAERLAADGNSSDGARERDDD